MRTPLLLTMTLIGTAFAGALSAQSTDRWNGPEPRENVAYGYADVLRVDPIYETFYVREPREECREVATEYQERRGGDPTGGTILGALIGGALGNQVGKGDGRRAATVAGAVIGGAIGHNVDKNNGSQGGQVVQGTRQDCRVVDVEREDRRVAGYDVEYRYRGEVFLSRLNYDPGERLRVRVSVEPVE